MENRLSVKVKAAAVAAWWTILIAYGIVLLQWLLLLCFGAHPGFWTSPLFGGYDWETIRILWLWGVAAMKICIWVFLLVAVWLSLWSRGLAKREC